MGNITMTLEKFRRIASVDDTFQLAGNADHEMKVVYTGPFSFAFASLKNNELFTTQMFLNKVNLIVTSCKKLRKYDHFKKLKVPTVSSVWKLKTAQGPVVDVNNVFVSISPRKGISNSLTRLDFFMANYEPVK